MLMLLKLIFNLLIVGPSTLKLMLSGSMSVIPCRARYHCTSLFDLFKVIKFIIILSRTQKADSPKLVPLGAVDIDVIFPGRLASRPHYHLVSSVRISDKRSHIYFYTGVCPEPPLQSSGNCIQLPSCISPTPTKEIISAE